MFESDEEIWLLLLAAGRVLQRVALLDGIVLLGVAGRDLLPVDAALEDFHRGRVVGRELGQRHEFLRQMRDERRLNQCRLDEFLESGIGSLEVLMNLPNAHKAISTRRSFEPAKAL